MSRGHAHWHESWALWFGWLGVVVLSCSPASAQRSSSAAFGDWLDQDTMTGDWGGARTRLKAAGIELRGHYTSESAYNPSGGRRETARYTQQLDVGADLDVERLAGISGGQILITMTHRAGRSLSADALGNNQFAVQELFGEGQNFRLVELHYQQQLLDRKLLFDIGWAPLGGYFATSPLYCEYFQTLATCGMFSFNGSWQTWPRGQWGARVRFQPSPAYYVSTGVYQVNPATSAKGAGFNLAFGGTGVVVPFEVGWSPAQDGRGLPGEYKLGSYFDSSRASDVYQDVNGRSAGLTGAPFAQHNGRWGVYALATQTVYRETSDAKRGLTLFGIAAAFDPQTAPIRSFLAAGAIYQGTLAHRDDDFVSLVFARIRYNSRLTRFQRDLASVVPGAVGMQSYESVVELDYGIAVAPWLKLRPNLQYVMRPGGTGKIPDASVVGLFAQITF